MKMNSINGNDNNDIDERYIRYNDNQKNINKYGYNENSPGVPAIQVWNLAPLPV